MFGRECYPTHVSFRLGTDLAPGAENQRVVAMDGCARQVQIDGKCKMRWECSSVEVGLWVRSRAHDGTWVQLMEIRGYSSNCELDICIEGMDLLRI